MNLNDLSWPRFLNVIYVMLTRNQTEETRKDIDSAIWPVTEEQWGETPDAVSAQEAMMQMVGD